MVVPTIAITRNMRSGVIPPAGMDGTSACFTICRSEEHTSELQSLRHLVCRLLLEKKQEGGRDLWAQCWSILMGRGGGACGRGHWAQVGNMRMGCGCVKVVQGICFFFFNDTATTEIYTLSLHDALPI